MDKRELRRNLHFGNVLEEEKHGWYHSFALPDGTVIDGYQPLDHLEYRWSRLPLPKDLGGRRVLDIGAWDGWMSFEAERHGAEVTAIDVFQSDNFLDIHQRLNSRVDYRVLDIYDLPDAGLGTFDYVFFLGVLYHVRHPLLALEIVAAHTREIAIVDSFVTDSATWQDHPGEIPTLEFYETYELGQQFDNWFGPTVRCVLAMCRAAGFPRVELLYSEHSRAIAACYRRWEAYTPDPARPVPELASLVNNRDYGINFRSRRDQYMTCWFRAPAATLSELRFEVDGLGAQAFHLHEESPGVWVANVQLPPGLPAGWREVRLRLGDSGFSNPLQIAVDVPAKGGALRIAGACDGLSWKPGAVAMTEEGGFLSCWVHGLGENADRGNVRLTLAGTPLLPSFVGSPDESGLRQVNAPVPRWLERGEQLLTASFGGVASPPVTVRIG